MQNFAILVSGVMATLAPVSTSFNQFCDELSKKIVNEWNHITHKESPAQPTPRGNSELIEEMLNVVVPTYKPNQAEFSSYVGMLDQGASLEGIYNGLTHSSFHRELEKQGPASKAAVETFVRELLLIENDLNPPTVFYVSMAQPIPPPTSLSLDPAPQGVDEAGLPEVIFKNASRYTLKRVLGDEALKVVGSKKTDKNARANWYSRWAVQLCSRGVDFGLVLRNKPDRKFHYEWAMTANDDKLDWEVLNRLHRIMNAVN